MNNGRAVPIYRRKGFQLAVGLLIAAIFLGLAITPLVGNRQALQEIGDAFRQADYRWLPVMLAVLFLFYWLKAVRWRLLLRPVGDFRPLKDLFSPILIGFAINNSLPARIGEFVRCYVFSRQQRVPLVLSLSSVVLERVFDAIAIVTYLAIGLWFVQGIDPNIQRAGQAVAIMALIGAGSGLAFVIWTKTFIAIFKALLSRLPFVPESLVDRICHTLETAAAGLAALKNLPLLLAILALSFVKWGLNALLFWLSLWSFGIPVSALVALVLMGVVAVMVAPPQAPGFFGTIQFCFMAVMKLFPVPTTTVFAASIYYHLVTWSVVTVTGLILFATTGLSLKQVQIEEDQRDRAPTTDPPAPS